MTASLLPLAGLLVLGGRLGDRYGRRRIFLLGALLFGGASAIAGFGPLFADSDRRSDRAGRGRGADAAGDGRDRQPSCRQRMPGSALGTMGGVAAVAGALGPTIGGVFTSVFSWRAVLLVNVPLLHHAVSHAPRGGARWVTAKQAPHIDISGRCCCAPRWSVWSSGLPRPRNGSFGLPGGVRPGRDQPSSPRPCSCGVSGGRPTR